ncbi:hypothetical protein D9M71_500520 [compost metagenome]
MPVHRRVNTGKLRSFLAVEIERRRHDGAANVFSFRLVLQPVAVVHHLLIEERLCILFLIARLNPKRPLDQLPHHDEVPFLVVSRVGRDMNNHALDEVLGGLIPVRVFLICRLHDNRLGNQRGIFKKCFAACFQEAHGVVRGAVFSGRFAGNTEGVNDINLLPQGCTFICRDVRQFALGVGREDAARIEQQVADQADRFTRTRARHGENMAVILDANKLITQRTDQDFLPRLARVIREYAARGNVFELHPSRLWHFLFP